MTVQRDVVVISAGFYGGREPEYGNDLVHLVCACRLHVNYCGRFEPDTEPSSEAVDGTECPACLDIWANGACPNCGCTKFEECGKCAQ